MLLAALVAVGIEGLSAQSVRINIGGAAYTRPLLERLAAEYAKTAPGFKVELVKDGDADGTLEIDSVAGAGTVGRAVVLPFANSKSPLLSDKAVRRGLTGKLARRLFVAQDYLEALDAQDEGERPLPGTVYALTGSKASTTRLFARSLGARPSDLTGKKVLGREENVVSAVRAHDDAVSFNVANLLYSLADRRQAEGLTVLPVDLDGNGRISDEERAAVADLDSLIGFLSHRQGDALPVGNINIESANADVLRFVNWAASDGQQYLMQQGYLPTSAWLTAQK